MLPSRIESSLAHNSGITTDARLPKDLGITASETRATNPASGDIKQGEKETKQKTAAHAPRGAHKKHTPQISTPKATKAAPRSSAASVRIVQAVQNAVRRSFGHRPPPPGTVEARYLPSYLTALFVAPGSLSSAQVPRAVGRANERVRVWLLRCVVLSTPEPTADPAVSDGMDGAEKDEYIRAEGADLRCGG